jgi:N utilization substance protein B
MAPVEKSILRVALFEVLFDNRRVPLRAAISEAVELAKVFGGESAPRFVNGVLSTIAAETETPGARPSAEPRSTRTEERER